MREDVKRWREAGYRGSSSVTRDLLRYWTSKDRPRRLFFCQREAVETIIYLAELRLAGKSSRTGFQKFSLDDEAIRRLLHGDKPSFHLTADQNYPTLIDVPADSTLLPLRRMGLQDGDWLCEDCFDGDANCVGFLQPRSESSEQRVSQRRLDLLPKPDCKRASTGDYYQIAACVESL